MCQLKINQGNLRMKFQKINQYLLLLILMLSGDPSYGLKLPTQFLHKYGLSFKADEHWSIDSQVHQSEGAAQIEIIKLTNSFEKLAIELTFIGPVTDQIYEETSKVEYSSIENLYKPMVTPYPGSISKKNVCPQRFFNLKKQIIFLGTKIRVIIAKASARGTFGVCDKQSAFYDISFLTFHLKNNYFIKISTLQDQVNPNSIQLKKIQQTLSLFKLN